MKYDYLVVGAGFAGCVLAERLASECGRKVLLIDRRHHLGGNAYDSVDEAGIRIHHYGPHLFHTNSQKIFQYLSRFTAWHPYEHRVRSFVNGMLVPMPINRTTINMLFGCAFTSDEETAAFLEKERDASIAVTNSEDYVVSKVGRRLYELLYRGYSTKHWGRDPHLLDPSVCGRLPVRLNAEDRYFDDQYQGVPLHGYTAMFAKMISHPNIHCELNTSFFDVPESRFDRLIYTGPIDEYFGFMYGKLPYRSARFEFETHHTDKVQPVAQVNYPNEFEFTRITEFRHITGQMHTHSTIAREYPTDDGEPCYPIPQKEMQTLYSRYASAAASLQTVHFVGRLAEYRYYNMDQVVGRSLSIFKLLAEGCR